MSRQPSSHSASYWIERLGLTCHPAGCWFGAELVDSGEYALVGCSVAPGFDFNDFEMASGEELIALFPQHAALIGRMTRG